MADCARSRSRGRSLLLAAVVCSGSAVADESEPYRQQVAQIENLTIEDLLNLDVVTASKTAEKSSESPATVRVVTADTIRLRGYHSLNELLADLPEVEIQEKSNTEYSNVYTLRGIAGNEKFLLLQDGIRILSAVGTPQAVRTNISLAGVKRVEVILGPASALYGVDAFSGVVNLITEDREAPTQLRARAGGGRFGAAAAAATAHAKVNDSLSLTATVDGYRADEPFFPDYYRADYDWYFNQYQAGLMANPTPGGAPLNIGSPVPYGTPTRSTFLSARVDVGDFQFGYNRNAESHSSAVGMKPSTHLYRSDDVYGLLNQSFFGRYRIESGDKRWGLETTLSHAAEEIPNSSVFRNIFTGYSAGYKYGRGSVGRLETQLHVALSDPQQLIVGASYEDIGALAKTGDLPLPFDSDRAAASQQIAYLGTSAHPIYQDFYELHYNNIGSYAQVQSRWTPWLRTTIGSRIDGNSRYGWSANPRAGVVISPSHPVTVKLLYGEAFLSPSPYKAYQHYGAFVDVGGGSYIAPFWHLANPDLKPEKLRSGEASVSYYPSDSINVSADAFYTRVDDVIQDATTVGGQLSFKGIPVSVAVRPENQGVERTYGGTLQLSTLTKLDQLQLSSSIAYTYVDGSIDRIDVSWRTLPFAARHTLKLGVDARVGPVALSPRFTFRGRTYHPLNSHLESGVAVPDSAPPYGVLDATATLQLERWLPPSLSADLWVKARNLLDRRYYNVSYGQSEALSETPQDPLSVLVGFTVATR